MIRQIKYVFSASVDYFTCHALFSTITDKYVEKMHVNAYTKQPIYKVTFQDRVITLWVEDSIPVQCPNFIEFFHKGKKIQGKLWKNTEYVPQYTFKEGEYVFAFGVINYARKEKYLETSRNYTPVNGLGNFEKKENMSVKQESLLYLSNKLGIQLKDEDQRDFRFELLTHDHFDNGHCVFSKTNNNRITIHNSFSFAVKGYIVDANKVNQLDYCSIGKKRSYGLGNIEIHRV